MQPAPSGAGGSGGKTWGQMRHKAGEEVQGRTAMPAPHVTEHADHVPTCQSYAGMGVADGAADGALLDFSGGAVPVALDGVRVAPANEGEGVRHAVAVHCAVPSGLAATAVQKPVSYFQPSWLVQRTGRARCPCRRRRTRNAWQRIERNA